jgi:hypothetical protein
MAGIAFDSAAADMQPVDLILQQRDRIVRTLQVRHQVGRGAADIARDVWSSLQFAPSELTG